MVGSQPVRAVGEYVELLMDRDPRRPAPITLDHRDVGTVGPERTRRRHQTQRPTLTDLRPQKNLHIPNRNGNDTCTLGCSDPGSCDTR